MDDSRPTKQPDAQPLIRSEPERERRYPVRVRSTFVRLMRRTQASPA